ncbi:HDOD domain-containing protein [Denitratisoma oestradiolicum]|uniref:Histidine kinase n=1 Tax=Denitratisoma oestradiolicum TaxID=311182 RepID=A0A6S6XVB8_9PROT|nr:HDOD domain-containing protein [Denitratisoma oestradiolicum]TWO80159.1 histidine kinase [Denitratisoma oestradiolicum]CAB1369994.1 Histidine kinase [Denitratisoma oestradiolicum]
MSSDEQALMDLVARGVKLPPQPQVLVQLEDNLSRGDPDVRTLARTIAQDPGLTAMLFKAARSPLFNPRNRNLDRLDQVLMVIGSKQCLNLARAFSLATSIPGAHRHGMEVFWVRARELARLAALIADDRITVCNVFPDQAYLAGVFYECGVPLLMQRFPDYCQGLTMNTVNSWPSLQEEDQRFNVDHVTIGYLVARHWKLPDFIAQAIRCHREIPHADMGATRSLVAILQLAVHFFFRVNRIDDAHWPILADEVLGELCILPEELEDFFDRISDRFDAES